MYKRKAEAFVLVETKTNKTKDVSTSFLGFKEIVNVHELYGQYDIILKVITEDMASLEDFLQNKIRMTPDVTRTETLIVSDIPK